jgi:mevalonate pyrophosphate decarboxylase
LIYWDTDEAGKPIQLSSASVFSAIEGALHNQIPYKNSQNIVERMAKVRLSSSTRTQAILT